MNIYLLKRHSGEYEEDLDYGVYTTIKKATKAVKDYIKSENDPLEDYEYFFVVEVEVDGAADLMMCSPEIKI